MVANAHALQLDLSEVRRRFAVSLKGATLQQLITHANQLNFSSRPLRLELDELAQLQLPCILHWDLNHFVVLKKVGRGNITILDPAVGERKLALAEVSRHFTGVALELTPNADFKPADQRQRVALSAFTDIYAFNRWLFKVSGSLVVCAMQRGLVSLAGSTLIAWLILATDTKIRDVDAEYLYIQIFFLVILAPLIENIFLVFIIELLVKNKRSQSLISLISAAALSGIHSLFSPTWGVVVFWPFYIFGAAYIGGRDLGKKRAYFLSVLIHGIQNIPGAVMLFLDYN